LFIWFCKTEGSVEVTVVDTFVVSVELVWATGSVWATGALATGAAWVLIDTDITHTPSFYYFRFYIPNNISAFFDKN
jgi:hypothetical protein